jgi:hypothetical protein
MTDVNFDEYITPSEASAQVKSCTPATFLKYVYTDRGPKRTPVTAKLSLIARSDLAAWDKERLAQKKAGRKKEAAR